MSLTLRISLLIGILVYVAVVLLFLRRKSLTLKYSLLWLFSAFILLILTIFPRLSERVSSLLGIESVINGMFLIFIFCILLLLISLTAIVSKQHRQIKILVQHTAVLEKRLDDLKAQIGGE